MDVEGNVVPAVQATMLNSYDCAMESMATEYEDMLAILQYKFDILYAHCANLANEMEEKDESLILMETKLYWLKLRQEKGRDCRHGSHSRSNCQAIWA